MPADSKYGILLLSIENSIRSLVNKANQCKETPNFIEDNYMVGYYSATINALEMISSALEANNIDFGNIKVTKIKRL